MLLERGKGDSIKEITEYWGNASIDEIHERVLLWKAKRTSIRLGISCLNGIILLIMIN